MSLVEEAIRTWEIQRAETIAEVENLPEEHFDFRPGEGARTLRELALHVAQAGVVFSAEILRPEGSLLRLFDPPTRKEHLAGLPRAESKEEILTLLRGTGERTAAQLRETGEALSTQSMETFFGTQSRLAALWFCVGHEMYHCGQLASYARAVGRVPALTQQLAAMLSSEGGPATAT